VRAFSLVELTMVMVIIAVAAAIAAPRWTESLGRYRVDAAARRIVADLALAQTNARATSSPRTITFDPGAETYQLSSLKDFETGSGSYTVNLKGAPYLADLASTGFTAASPLTFNAFGVPSTGGSLTVSSGGFSRTITIDPDSGTATIQ
jgi:prepilin-type N-terminal cleavage/methylation domain-containing protein